MAKKILTQLATHLLCSVFLIFTFSPIAVASDHKTVISVQIQIPAKKPDTLFLSGAFSKKIDAFDQVPININVPISSEKFSAKLILNPKYSKDVSYELGFSFRPIHSKSTQIIDLPFVQNNFKQANSIARTTCQGNGVSNLNNIEIYVTCRSIFQYYNNTGEGDTHNGLRALRGAFDAYVKLIIFSENNGIFSRDIWLEDEAMEVDKDSKTNSTLKRRFKTLGLRQGYLTDMVKQLDAAGVSSFNNVKIMLVKIREKDFSEQSKKSLMRTIDAEIRYLENQINSSTNKIINGIGISHINQIKADLSNFKIN